MKPPHSIIEQTRRTRVVLSACRHDQDLTDNAPANLAALCQRCHVLHERSEHLRRRRLTYLARRALGDLFSGATAIIIIDGPALVFCHLTHAQASINDKL